MFDNELKGFEFPEDKAVGHSLRPYTINNWVGAAIAAGGALLSGLMGGGGGGGATYAKLESKTVSGSQLQDFDVLYDSYAISNMYELGDVLNTISAEDRAWFNDIYKPFQERMVEMNQSILPTIEKTQGDALEHIARSLVSGEAMVKVMEAKAKEGIGPEAKAAVSAFQEQLRDLPTESERVGQALTNVESAFTGAGKELARDYQSRGQTVSQASKRQMLLEKAKAKAGAAGLASEASRAERLSAAERGAGLALQVDQMEAEREQRSLEAAASMQAQFGGLAQTAVGAAKSGLVEIDPITGLETMGLQGEVTQALATQQYGTRGRADTVEYTQKGTDKPVITSGAGTGMYGSTVGGVKGSSGGGQAFGQLPGGYTDTLMGAPGGLPAPGSGTGGVGTRNVAGGFHAVTGEKWDRPTTTTSAQQSELDAYKKQVDKLVAQAAKAKKQKRMEEKSRR